MLYWIGIVALSLLALCFLVLVGLCAWGVVMYSRSPEKRLVRRFEKFKSDLDRLLSETHQELEMNPVDPADEAAIREEAFQEFLSHVSVTQLENYSGIGRSTTKSLKESGFKNLKLLLQGGIEKAGLGPKRTAEVEKAVQQLFQAGKARFARGDCKEAKELPGKLREAALERTEAGVRSLCKLHILEEAQRRFAACGPIIIALEQYSWEMPEELVRLAEEKADYFDIQALLDRAEEETRTRWAKVQERRGITTPAALPAPATLQPSAAANVQGATTNITNTQKETPIATTSVALPPIVQTPASPPPIVTKPVALPPIVQTPAATPQVATTPATTPSIATTQGVPTQSAKAQEPPRPTEKTAPPTPAPTSTPRVSWNVVSAQGETAIVEPASQRADLFSEILRSPERQGSTPETPPRIDHLQLFVKFAYAAAKADGKISQKERNVIDNYVRRRFEREKDLQPRLRSLYAQYESARIEVTECVEEMNRSLSLEERRDLFQLAEAIADASGPRNDREARFLQQIGDQLGVKLSPLPQPPAPKPTAVVPPATGTATGTGAVVSAPRAALPTGAEARIILDIEPTTTLTADLIRRQYNLLTEKYAHDKFAVMGAEFITLAESKRNAVRSAALALLQPLGEQLEIPSRPAPQDIRHNPDLDAMFD